MWKKIGTAIVAALQAMSKTVFKFVLEGGKMVLKPFKVLEQAISGPGPQAQSAAYEASVQDQQTDKATQQAREAGEYAGNLRGLARRRFENLAIDDSLLNRVSPDLQAYLSELTLAECEIVSKLRIKQIASFLNAKADKKIEIAGLRHPREILALSQTSSNNFSTKKTMTELKAANPIDLDAIRDLIDSSISNTKHEYDEEEPVVSRRI